MFLRGEHLRLGGRQLHCKHVALVRQRASHMLTGLLRKACSIDVWCVMRLAVLCCRSSGGTWAAWTTWARCATSCAPTAGPVTR